VTPEEELLATLRARGAAVAETGGELVITGRITSEELAFATAHAEALVALLRQPAPPTEDPEVVRIKVDLDAALLREQAAEATKAAERNTPRRNPRWSVFRLADQPYGDRYLHQLTAAQVQRLRAAGKITDDQVREWLALQDPKQKRTKASQLF
jgi:hypothetical protein